MLHDGAEAESPMTPCAHLESRSSIMTEVRQPSARGVEMRSDRGAKPATKFDLQLQSAHMPPMQSEVNDMSSKITQNRDISRSKAGAWTEALNRAQGAKFCSLRSYVMIVASGIVVPLRWKCVLTCR